MERAIRIEPQRTCEASSEVLPSVSIRPRSSRLTESHPSFPGSCSRFFFGCPIPPCGKCARSPSVLRFRLARYALVSTNESDVPQQPTDSCISGRLRTFGASDSTLLNSSAHSLTGLGATCMKCRRVLDESHRYWNIKEVVPRCGLFRA